MSLRSTRTGRAARLATTVALFMGLAAPVQAMVPADAPRIPTATTSTGSKIVGALFPKGSSQHSCSASVVSSSSGSLVLTAAHCVSGSVAGWRFVPQWSQGHAPYGSWTVTAAYASSRWIKHGDTRDDVAVLSVAAKTINGHRRTLQSVTGAAHLGTAPKTGQRITDIAYNDGDTQPVQCTTTTYVTSGYPSFNCHGFLGGSSGSPWLVGSGSSRTVVGLIGGLHQGGCVDYTSYSSPFGATVQSLLRRAESGARGDTLPTPGDDGC